MREFRFELMKFFSANPCDLGGDYLILIFRIFTTMPKALISKQEGEDVPNQ